MRHRIYKRAWFSNVSLPEILFCLVIIMILNGFMYRIGNTYMDRAKMVVLNSALGNHTEMLLTQYILTGAWPDNVEYISGDKGDATAVDLIKQLDSKQAKTNDVDNLEKVAKKSNVLSHWLKGPTENIDNLLSSEAGANKEDLRTYNTVSKQSVNTNYRHFNGYETGNGYRVNYYFTVNGSIVYRHNFLSKQEGRPVFIGFAPVMYQEREAMAVRYICNERELHGMRTVGPLINTTGKDKASTACYE